MVRDRVKAIVWIGLLGIAICTWGTRSGDASVGTANLPAGSTTVLFYMNGDNDLTDEVLSAVDAMETIGSSARLNIVALVDGHPRGVGRFGKKWVGTHLLHITTDHRSAQIRSTVLADWGERDLGDPDTLARFVRVTIERFPADRYIFCTFAHGKGVIDTGNLTGSSNAKSLFISPDATSQTIMPLGAFTRALQTGLDGRRFSIVVLFSCLSSMVEIGYALGLVTDYLVASEDEIRIVNDPPGTHQLRGIAFEPMLQQLQTNPHISEIELGRSMVNRFIESYTRPVGTTGPGGRMRYYRYPAGLTLVDCRSIEPLVSGIDALASRLIEGLNRPETSSETLASLQSALRRSQTFKSFLNLQYYDLLDLLDHLALLSTNEDIRQMSRHSAALLRFSVIRFERHTDDAGANGMAIFFNHPLVPENIYTAHRAMYRRTRFGRNTRWDQLIHTYRTRMQQR